MRQFYAHPHSQTAPCGGADFDFAPSHGDEQFLAVTLLAPLVAVQKRSAILLSEGHFKGHFAGYGQLAWHEPFSGLGTICGVSDKCPDRRSLRPAVHFSRNAVFPASNVKNVNHHARWICAASLPPLTNNVEFSLSHVGQFSAVAVQGLQDAVHAHCCLRSRPMDRISIEDIEAKGSQLQ
jgi:hypothetical protein